MESQARWRRSSYSGPSGGECLEVADGTPDAVPIRDSKRPDGPILLVQAPAWTAFIGAVRTRDALKG
ncbi:DUF397 domain-containing protein [Streptomyces uncialis]|uniref:DUF397 domain-containing protein n=1 Tax=Streptomyces uncialis TaxID=1048205 RepID=UPI0038670475|nr:DUF397 domain-containing protein [Streptomyces uncialis]